MNRLFFQIDSGAGARLSLSLIRSILFDKQTISMLMDGGYTFREVSSIYLYVHECKNRTIKM